MRFNLRIQGPVYFAISDRSSRLWDMQTARAKWHPRRRMTPLLAYAAALPRMTCPVTDLDDNGRGPEGPSDARASAASTRFARHERSEVRRSQPYGLEDRNASGMASRRPIYQSSRRSILRSDRVFGHRLAQLLLWNALTGSSANSTTRDSRPRCHRSTASVAGSRRGRRVSAVG